MIDSVVIELRKGQFEIIDKTKFDCSSSRQMANKYSVNTSHSTAADIYRKKGFYFPRITIPKRKDNRQSLETLTPKRKDSRQALETLEIQVSLPKMTYGTNLFEIDEIFLDLICSRLSLCLKKVGVNALSYDIKKAVVKRVDYSKAVILQPHYGTAKQVIRKLRNFDYKRSSDFRHQDDCTNADGVTLKFWNNTQGLCNLRQSK